MKPPLVISDDKMLGKGRWQSSFLVAYVASEKLWILYLHSWAMFFNRLLESFFAQTKHKPEQVKILGSGIVEGNEYYKRVNAYFFFPDQPLNLKAVRQVLEKAFPAPGTEMRVVDPAETRKNLFETS